jgi:hypothetical protein
LYRRLGDSSLDRINAGTAASTPNPNMYIIGVNCEAVSPANTPHADYGTYKNLALML